MKPLLNTLTQITSLLLFKMTYSQKANPNATNSELDAKVVIDHTKLSKDEEEKIIQDLMKEASPIVINLPEGTNLTHRKWEDR